MAQSYIVSVVCAEPHYLSYRLNNMKLYISPNGIRPFLRFNYTAIKCIVLSTHYYEIHITSLFIRYFEL